jgi:lipopolysaccharide/colanic/teichoic acid biosynthesis glycosyltransferase
VRSRARAAVGSQVLGERLFQDAFVRERKRAERFGQPFAVLLLDRGDRSPVAGTWNQVLRAVAGAKRSVDIVGWLDEGALLGLLLPDMPGHGALDVMGRLKDDLARRLGDAPLAALSIRLYVHGEKPGPNAKHYPSVDLLSEAFVKRQYRSRLCDAAKRGLDVAGSLGLLAVLSPVLLAAFAAVKWTSPGPALFRQVRIGRRGQAFTMLKFRSMYLNAGHAAHQDYVTWFIKSSGSQPRTGNEVFKLTNDSRVTSIGHFLRKTSIDELPQFWNVLRGDMSLVGPRPPLPFEVEQYQPWHRRRVLDAKPGVTGLWQVNGRSRTTFDEMVRLDLRYARTRTLWMDLRILAATPRAVLSGRGAC